MNEGVSVVLRGCDQLRSSSIESTLTPSTTTESRSTLESEVTANKSESGIEENENILRLRENAMDNCRNADANEFIAMEDKDESMNVDTTARMAELRIEKDNLVGKNDKKSVSFPSNDNELVTGYFEPANPWQHAHNVKAEDIISRYKESCIHHNTEPLENVIKQIKNMEITQTRVSELCLKHENLDREHCEPLEEIFKRLQFHKIDLEAASLDDESAEALFDMFEYYESARHINISNNCNIGARGWQSCAHMLKKMLCLERLDAKDIVLTQQHFIILKRPLQLVSNLKILKLENCNIAGRAFVMLVAALKMNNGLKELYLADNHLDNPDGVMLGSLLKANHHLQLLDLSNNNLGDAGARELISGLIAQANNSPCGYGLSVLIMWNNKLTKGLARYFSELIARSKSLETLNIGKNVLEDEFLGICEESLTKNDHLLQLGLQSTSLGTKSVMVLADVIKHNATLQRIDLRDNNIQLMPLTFFSLALKKNTTVTQIDLDDTPASKLMLPLTDQYVELVSEIRGYCARNEEPKSMDSTSEESTSSPQQRSRLSSYSSRKISLTCQTLPRTPPTMATSASGITTANDIHGRSTLICESKRPSGGRLRSPAPSPIPSPVASPIPSPSRSRFVVSRVSEQTLNNSNNSSTSSSPITTPSPLSVSPTCFFSSSTGITNSRFRVTIIEPATPPTTPLSSLSSSPVSLPVNNFIVTSSPSATINVDFHCHDETATSSVNNCNNELDNTKSSSNLSSNSNEVANNDIVLENLKLIQSSNTNELSIVNDGSDVKNFELIHSPSKNSNTNMNINTNYNNDVRIDETNRICQNSDELKTQELLKTNKIELENLVSSLNLIPNESTILNDENKVLESIETSSSSLITNVNINSNQNRETIEKIDSDVLKCCKSPNSNVKSEWKNIESTQNPNSSQYNHEKRIEKHVDVDSDGWDYDKLSGGESELKNMKSIPICHEQSSQIVEQDQSQQHTTSLERLLELFQRPSHLFNTAFDESTESKSTLHRSMSSLIELGDKFQQYLRDGRGTDDSKQNQSSKRLTSSETQLCSSRDENADLMDHKTTTNFLEDERDINVPVNGLKDNFSNVPELLLIDGNNSSSIVNASNSNLDYAETFNKTLNNDVNELCDSSGTNCSINSLYSYENNFQCNIISDINNVNIVNNTGESIDNVNSEIFNINKDGILVVAVNEVRNDIEVELKDETKRIGNNDGIDIQVENEIGNIDDDINSILASILDTIPYETTNLNVNDDKLLSDFIEAPGKMNFNEKSLDNNHIMINDEKKYCNNEFTPINDDTIDKIVKQNITADEFIKNNQKESVENIYDDKVEFIDTINSKQTDTLDVNYSCSRINNETSDLTLSSDNSSAHPIDNNLTLPITTTTTTTMTLVKNGNTEEICQLSNTTINLITNDNNYGDKLLENNYSDSADVFTDDLIFNIANITIRDGPISSDQSIMFEHNSETSSNIDTLSENPSSSRDSFQGSIDSGIDDLLIKDKRNVDSKMAINIPIINDNDNLSKDKTIESITIVQNDDNKLPTDSIHITTDNANASNDIVNSTGLD